MTTFAYHATSYLFHRWQPKHFLTARYEMKQERYWQKYLKWDLIKKLVYICALFKIVISKIFNNCICRAENDDDKNAIQLNLKNLGFPDESK